MQNFHQPVSCKSELQATHWCSNVLWGAIPLRSYARCDDLAEYAKTVSFDWLNNVLKLWEAVGAEAPQDEMEEMFTSLRLDVEGLASDPVKTTPQHQYRTRLLDILEEIWSEIDTSDWEGTPPKKISIETDVTNRFGLSQREASMIASMFIPDNRRGKSQMG